MLLQYWYCTCIHCVVFPSIYLLMKCYFFCISGVTHKYEHTSKSRPCGRVVKLKRQIADTDVKNNKFRPPNGVMVTIEPLSHCTRRYEFICFATNLGYEGTKEREREREEKEKRKKWDRWTDGINSLFCFSTLCVQSSTNCIPLKSYRF